MLTEKGDNALVYMDTKMLSINHHLTTHSIFWIT